ncbi:hypothetical protein SAMN06265222_11979 [Neorhodopirellula lusitana]|uniref:Uncharacterized protein n=1 Tax=Neorhodopirellula lusitana TaxID=445327 RepID=A0ABY1QMI4_9BACT|nr:hypothetical protein [Neorhodopirellula lusitana]SMP75574.1 hypothetical protein SAMN06265222_11979 [Neorhodopirellula lusitana]
MKPATISELKKSLAHLDRDELLDACVRLAKFKVDNKSLLTYLLMKSDDELAYADEVCDAIDEQFLEAYVGTNRSLHKKTLRKIIREFEKCIRYSGDKETELKIRIHFCRQFFDRKLRFGRCRVSANMYASQLKKIDKAIDKLHPDLQYDARRETQGFDSLL